MDYLEIIERRKVNMKRNFQIALELAAVETRREQLMAERHKLQKERQELDDLLFGRMRQEVGIPAQDPPVEAEMRGERA